MLPWAKVDVSNRGNFATNRPNQTRRFQDFQFGILGHGLYLVWGQFLGAYLRQFRHGHECGRILRGGGKMLAWVSVETELMEPSELGGYMRRSVSNYALCPETAPGLMFWFN